MEVSLVLPGMDVSRIGQLALLVLMLMQYVKNRVPEWLLKPWLQMFFGVGLSVWSVLYASPQGTLLSSLNWLVVVSDGIFSAVAADGGYQLLKNTPESPRFSLPRREQ